MAFDLAAAKTRLNITDTAQDVVIQAALDASVAVAESYCKRKFMRASETNVFHWVDGVTLQFERYPINNVLAIRDTGNGTATSSMTNSKYYEVYNSAGQIRFSGHIFSKSLEVDTDAGYAVLPADLELALWLIFDGVWNQLNNAGSGNTGGIASISVPDVGKITYSTGSSSSGNTNAGLIPATGIAILDNYIAQRA